MHACFAVMQEGKLKMHGGVVREIMAGGGELLRSMYRLPLSRQYKSDCSPGASRIHA